MSKINSRQKGANFELVVAAAFNEWCKNRWTFRRSPLSGGWDPKAQTGDVFPLELKDAWPYIIEVRKNEQYTLDGLLNDNDIVRKWLEEKTKLYRGHAKEHKLPYKPVIFVMCRNRVQPVVVFDSESIEGIFPVREPEWFAKITGMPHVRVKRREMEFLYIVNLNVFLENFDVSHHFPEETEEKDVPSQDPT